MRWASLTLADELLLDGPALCDLVAESDDTLVTDVDRRRRREYCHYFVLTLHAEATGNVLGALLSPHPRDVIAQLTPAFLCCALAHIASLHDLTVVAGHQHRLQPFPSNG
jgi:hypothetical protein